MLMQKITSAMNPWWLPVVLLLAEDCWSDQAEDVSGCYNKNLSLLLVEPPSPDGPNATDPSVYFTPRIPPGPKRLVLDNGELKDDRYNVVSNSSGVFFEVYHLRAEDQGLFLVLFNDMDGTNETYSLTVTECSHLENVEYGGNLSILLEGDLLEFTRRGSYLEPTLLWNRSDPSVSNGKRGQVMADLWLVKNLTQADQGNYTVRDVSGLPVSTTVLMVTETKIYESLEVDEDLIIDLPFSLAKVTLLFHPEIAKCNVNRRFRPRVLVRDGVLVLEEKQTYEGRLKMSNYQIVIEEFQMADLGSYHVHDPQGNLALTIEADIIRPAETWKLAVGPLLGILLILAYYCKGKGRRCCGGRPTTSPVPT